MLPHGVSVFHECVCSLDLYEVSTDAAGYPSPLPREPNPLHTRAHPVFTGQDRMGRRVTRAGFAWHRIPSKKSPGTVVVSRTAVMITTGISNDCETKEME